MFYCRGVGREGWGLAQAPTLKLGGTYCIWPLTFWHLKVAAFCCIVPVGRVWCLYIFSVQCGRLRQITWLSWVLNMYCRLLTDWFSALLGFSLDARSPYNKVIQCGGPNEKWAPTNFYPALHDGVCAPPPYFQFASYAPLLICFTSHVFHV